MIPPACRPVDPARLRFAVVGGAGSLRPGATRAAVAACHLGVPAVRRDDVELAVHECLANALEHGHGGDASRPIDVEVARGDHATVTVRITDGGLDAGRVAIRDPDRGRGRALALVLAEGVVEQSTTLGTSVALRWAASRDVTRPPDAVDAGHGPYGSITAGGSEVEPWHG